MSVTSSPNADKPWLPPPTSSSKCGTGKWTSRQLSLLMTPLTKASLPMHCAFDSTNKPGGSFLGYPYQQRQSTSSFYLSNETSHIYPYIYRGVAHPSIRRASEWGISTDTSSRVSLSVQFGLIQGSYIPRIEECIDEWIGRGLSELRIRVVT